MSWGVIAVLVLAFAAGWLIEATHRRVHRRLEEARYQRRPREHKRPDRCTCPHVEGYPYGYIGAEISCPVHGLRWAQR